MRKAISATLAIFLTFFVCTFLTHASRGIKITAIEDLSHRSGKLGEFRALVIGINDYADPKIPNLETAVKDAGTMAGILAEKYGFTVERLFDRKATRAAIYQKLRSLTASTRPDDSVLIYFAGHGDLDRTYDDGWWIPTDAIGGNPVTYLSNVQVQMAMRSMKARHVLLISDSCYSGTLFGKSRALPPVINDKYYLGLYNEKSRWGMTSGNKEPVSDAGSEGHSVFAYQLLKELRRNAKPFVSIQEIYTRIAPIISNNSEQTPLCRPIRNTGDQGGEFVFVATVGSVLPVKKESIPSEAHTRPGFMDKEAMFWQSIENSDDPALFEAYLRQYPNGAFVPIAKRKLEILAPKKEVASISPEDTRPEPAPEILKAKLFVDTEPEGARVRILNIKPKFRQGIELDPGSYHIEVAARGHKMQRQLIKLGADEERRMSVELAKIPETGTIRVLGSPSGALVYVDGNLKGKMPVLIPDIKVGDHEIEVQADGFETGKRHLTIVPGRDDLINFTLKKINATGSIRISGSPNNARVYVDENYVGTMPLVVPNVTQGSHRVRVESDGHGTRALWVSLGAGEDKNMVVRLERGAAGISGDRFTNSLGMEFVAIPAGSFMIGSKLSRWEVIRKYGHTFGIKGKEYKEEHPRHNVKFTRGFYLQTTEVTQGQWRQVMGNNPSRFSSCGDNCPVETVSWHRAQEFIRKLNSMEGAGKYRLPTEAEWEYAARAGSTTVYCFGNEQARLSEYAWYDDNSGRKAHAVGQKKPNAWGLYDMHGNVWEWCQDWFGDYPSGSESDPQGPSSGSLRVLRGGCYKSDARFCRAAYRRRISPGWPGGENGFRLVRIH